MRIENYHYSKSAKKPVTTVHNFKDDETVEIELNIRYPVRFKVAHLKKYLIENECAFNEYGEPITAEEFEKNPTVDESSLFFAVFLNFISQMIDETYDEFDEKSAKQIYDKLIRSEFISLLSDMSRPMRIKKIKPDDKSTLSSCSCCNPFPDSTILD